MNKKIMYIDMDNVLVDFQSGINALDKDTQEKYKGRYDETPGIFAKMQPMSGALEAVRALAEKFDLYILSTAPWRNPSAWSDKLNWIKQHLGDICYKRLILSHHKNLNRGDYLIDDRTNNGAGEFEGELLLFGSEKFPDWESIKKYFLHK